MIEANGIVTATFLVYLAVLLGVGAAAYRQTATVTDYLLGGRRMGRWVTALSAQASDMSGWLLLGLPGLAYLAGMESAWLAAGLAAGTYGNWKWVARRLREETGRFDSLTLPDYLASRFAEAGALLRPVSALLILVFFTFYVSSGLVAGGRLFETVFGLPYTWAVTAGAVAILLYTCAGGFFAVSWTDALQGTLMFLALLLTAVIVTLALTGTPDAAAIDPELLNPLTTADGERLGLIAVLSLLGWGLGYLGQPHILVRFMAIRDPAQLGFARGIAMVWVLVCMASAVTVGIAGIGFLAEPLEGADAERVFMVLVSALFHPVIAGICLAAILAAVMSTVDSQLLVASSAVTEDFYKKILRPRAGPGELLWLGRGAVAVIALAGFALAMDPEARVLELVAYAWAGFGAAFGPAILLALYWRDMNGAGALAGLITGGVTVMVWERLEGGLFDLYELVPGFLLAMLAIVLVSRFSRRKRPR